MRQPENRSRQVLKETIMKTVTAILLFVFSTCMLIALCRASHGGESALETPRWDLMMIKEAPIWKHLLNSYVYADPAKYWPERKAALEQVVAKYPESQWADDAALVLACGRCDFENDPKGAIHALKDIGSTYPDGQTIVVEWFIGERCIFDDVWLRSQGGLVFLNPDDTIRITKPFDRDGEISQGENEVLTYFEHLGKYPRSTKVTAEVFIAQQLLREGDTDAAISAMQAITSDSTGYLSKIVTADGVAASGPYGYYIREVPRPEVRAYFDLIGLYEHQGQSEKAVAKADELARSVNSGPRWDTIRRLGEFYESHNLTQKAKMEYQLALTAVNKYIEADRERSKHLEYIKPPTEQCLSPELKQQAAELTKLIAR